MSEIHPIGTFDHIYEIDFQLKQARSLETKYRMTTLTSVIDRRVGIGLTRMARTKRDSSVRANAKLGKPIANQRAIGPKQCHATLIWSRTRSPRE